MKGIFLFSVFLLTTSAFAEEMYIQAAKAQIKAEPKMNAATLVELPRGTAIQVLKTEGIWHEIQTGKQKGWVSKLFVSAHKPVGHADLVKDIDTDISKTSRRRTSSYAVSASTRGLAPSDRIRDGREEFPTDYESLIELEKLQLKPGELDEFRKTGGLNP